MKLLRNVVMGLLVALGAAYLLVAIPVLFVVVLFVFCVAGLLEFVGRFGQAH